MPVLTKEQLKQKLIVQCSEGGWRRRESVPVAVILVGRNYASFLSDAIESVTQQHPAPKEIIYVDNASTDGSAAIPKAQHIPVTVLSSVERNICACRNRGAQMTTAPYLVFMDADDVMPQGYLKTLYDVIDADERLGFVYPQAEQFGIYETGGDPCREGASRDDLLRQNVAVCPSMVRRTAFERVGGFDGLPMFHDWDLWLRITANHWQLCQVPCVKDQPY